MYTKIITHASCIHLTQRCRCPTKEIISPTIFCQDLYNAAASDEQLSIQLSETMKLQIVVTVLLVGCMLAQSLAAPLREKGEAEAVLQVIRMLLTSENYGHRELQQAENATTNPPVTSAPSNPTLNG